MAVLRHAKLGLSKSQPIHLLLAFSLAVSSRSPAYSSLDSVSRALFNSSEYVASPLVRDQLINLGFTSLFICPDLAH